MSKKKLLTLLAASSLALVACGEDTSQEDPATEESSEDTSEETGEDTSGETSEEDSSEESSDDQDTSSDDVFEKAAQRDDPDATVPVGLNVVGTWSTDGYVVSSEGDTAVLSLSALPGEGVENYYIYVTDEDGTILEKAENEEELEYTVEGVDGEVIYFAGTSEEDLGDVDDSVNPEEDFVRYERIIVQPGEEAPAEEEE